MSVGDPPAWLKPEASIITVWNFRAVARLRIFLMITDLQSTLWKTRGMEYRAPTREQKIRSVPDRRHPPDCLRGFRSEDCRCFVFHCLCSFYVCVPCVVPHSSIHNSFIHNSLHIYIYIYIFIIHNSLIHNSLIHNSFGRDANRDDFQKDKNRHNTTHLPLCTLGCRGSGGKRAAVPV